MTARSLPPRPDLDQLKRQAKELLESWKAAPRDGTQPMRLRDAQRDIAEQYGFDSWDALRTHVVELTGGADPGRHRPHRGIDYDDPIPDVVTLGGSLARDDVRRLAQRGVSGVKVGPSIAADAIAALADVPTLVRLDLSNRDDLTDDDLAFLERMPWLTALSLAGCGRISDAAVGHLRGHRALEQINLQWTNTGDQSVAVLAGRSALARVVLGRRLTDAGAASLRDFPALATPGALDSFLSVSSSKALTDDALASIGRLTGVRALDLHMSAFGSPHYTARGAAHQRGMMAHEELNFYGPLVNDAVLLEIAAIPRLRLLHAQDIASGDDGFIALAACATLENLGARFCRRITDRGFAAIAGLPRLSRLGLGGPRLSDGAMAALVDAPALVELTPNLFGDDAFRFIGRMPRLERLTNMYNRATTDAATRHLRNHPRLVRYSAFGTQITDESLRILATLPSLESLEFENCAGITDDGLRAVIQAPRLRRLSVWSCMSVTGTWTGAARPGMVVKSEPGPPGHTAGYRMETLLDYPDLAIPPDAQIPAGDAPSASLLSTLVCFGGVATFVDEGLKLSLDPGRDPRSAGLLTRDAYAIPLRIELVVNPIAELRLTFGRHNKLFVFDDRGNLENPAPWFIQLESDKGVAERDRDAPDLGEWTRVTLETGERERRLFVNGVLRHTWTDDFTGLRGRIAIGARKQSVTVRSLDVRPLRAESGLGARG
jgi:hypothetical protein